jgi:tetratricopeptide (TPR) repeat protein
LTAAAVFAFLLGAVVYGNTLGADFTLDDVPIIQENTVIRDLGKWREYFTTNYWGESAKYNDKSLYRPLTILSYALNYAVHGNEPKGYHAVNIVLHAVASALLVLMLAAMFGNILAAALAGILFAVHPIHTEAVAGIVGRAEIMAAIGTLLCCLAYVNGVHATRRGAAGAWLTLSVVAYAFGCYSKEIAVVAPVLILLWELTAGVHRRVAFQARALATIAVFVSFVVIATEYIIMRKQAILTVSKNIGFVGVSDFDRVLTGLRVCVEYVGLLLAPLRLSADYWVTDVPIARSVAEPGVAAAAAVLMVLIGVMVWSWRRAAMLAWGVGAFLIALFPVSNLPFAIGVMKAERILYTPSIGFLAAIAAAMAMTWRRASLRPAVLGVTVLASTLYAVRTVARNKDWQNNRVLAEATLRTSPESIIFNTIIATEYRKAGDSVSARHHLEKALAGQPDNTTSLFNLGNIELDEKRFEKAVDLYRRALAVEPKYLSALNNLGRALAELKRFEEAAEVLERSRSLRPESPASYVNLLSIYIQTRNMTVALPLAEEALRRFPDEAAVHWNAGSVLSIVGRKEEGAAVLRRAKELDKGSVERDIRTSLD